MYEHNVGFAVSTKVERLTSAHRNHVHSNSGLLLEDWQQMIEQA
jgi:hypothetical protein